ncbi:M20/M25/M40 family metallo-hydrolase [Tistrella mobilis]|uniref:M20/M25/M40 family metallo-hydrolase n=1 Tax=Tistrella mobilis TaxID=171437 RepID=UPI003557D555
MSVPASPSTDTARLAGIVDRNHETAIDFLSELVRTPSDAPPGDCTAIAEVTAGWLETLGFEVERVPVPEAAFGAAGVAAAPNLIVRAEFGPGPTIALVAHGDVPPPGHGWSVEPYAAVVRDGRMYGRGAAVAKSDIVAYALALRAIRQAGLSLGGTIELHLTWDEESGGEVGPPLILERRKTRPDFAICSGGSYAVGTRQNGCLHLEVTVEGRSAHAARPESGADAIEAALRIMQAVYELRDRLATAGGPPLVIGSLAGGTTPNMVADQARFVIDRRITPDEDPEAVEAELIRLVEQTGAGAGALKTHCTRLLLARPLTPVGEVARLSAAIRHAATREMGEEVGESSSALYSDARHYAAAGIPTVTYGAGPRDPEDAHGHRADERITLDDLRRATRIIAAALVELLPAGARNAGRKS